MTASLALAAGKAPQRQLGSHSAATRRAQSADQRVPLLACELENKLEPRAILVTEPL